MNTEATIETKIWSKVKDFVEQHEGVVEKVHEECVHVGPDKVDLAPLDAYISGTEGLRGEILQMVKDNAAVAPNSIDTDEVAEALVMVDNMWLSGVAARGHITHDATTRGKS